jgi:hypothetical protein
MLADQTNISRGVLQSGKGHMKDVTTLRIRPQAMGVAPSDEDVTVVKVTKASADVKLSAGGTRAVGAIASVFGNKKADAAAALGADWASNRGCKRIWDIDIACAVGFPRTPEGAKAFRSAFGLTGKGGVSTDWPTRVSETPTDKTPKGQVIDLTTGKVGSSVANLPAAPEPEKPETPAETPAAETPAETPAETVEA